MEVNLKVQKAGKDDVYKDVARIHHADRGNLPEGQICLLIANGKRQPVAIRGLGNDGDEKGCILLDEVTRGRLGVTCGKQYPFKIIKTGFWGQVWWSLEASDPGLRIAARIAVIALVLGALSVVLALCS